MYAIESFLVSAPCGNSAVPDLSFAEKETGFLVVVNLLRRKEF